MGTMIALQSGRLDRHVKRSYLRMSEGASRHRIAYSLEEALRLALLPGEDQGRIYCFRRVSLCGISAEANRRVWMEAVQQVLAAMAAQAVHGNNPRADASNAIFFHNREEALETLLRHALRGRSEIGATRPPWYAVSLLGVAEETSYEQQIPALLDLLRAPSVAPASAALLLAALDDLDPALLLSAIPTETAREWIRELEGAQETATDTPPLQLSEKLGTVLRRAAAQFGWKDPRIVWLAVQVVLCVAPNARMSGTAIRRARSTLRMLEAEQRSGTKECARLRDRGNRPGALVFDDESQLGAGVRLLPEAEPNLPSDGESLSGTEEAVYPEPLPIDKPTAGAPGLGEITQGESLSGTEEAVYPEPLLIDKPTAGAPGLGEITRGESLSGTEEAVYPKTLLIGKPTARAPLLGEITSCAGLFFLLNALRQLGIIAALDACPPLAEAGLASHILKRLSICAGVVDDDPILHCLPSADTRLSLDEEVLAGLQRKTACFPAGYIPTSRKDFNSDHLLRIWVLAVRRWCWRMGRLSLREIVHRKGRVWLTRTDLDITLPLEEADVRIRHIGLDIDPGWLPWFGTCGRVVRFHYRDREPGAQAC